MSYIEIRRNGDPISLPLHLDFQTNSTDGKTMVIDSRYLEDQMDKHLGWTLREVWFGEGTDEQAKICKRYLRRFSNSFEGTAWATKLSEANFQPHDGPVCMWYKTTADLIDHLSIIYQLMYFHYFLGRKWALGGSFPNYCCGVSSRNLTVALWEAGIVAAVSTYNVTFDHAYTIVPFAIADTGQTGVILADPTSDQLHRDPLKKVRNYLAVLPPGAWQYKTDWQRGENLYPEIVQVSSCFGAMVNGYSKYMRSAFRRPAVVV